MMHVCKCAGRNRKVKVVEASKSMIRVPTLPKKGEGYISASRVKATLEVGPGGVEATACTEGSACEASDGPGTGTLPFVSLI